MGIIGLVIIGGIALFLFLLYTTLKTKSRNLNGYAPFTEWIGKAVILGKKTILFKDHLPTYDNNKYPYVLLDSLHPRWPYVAQQLKSGDLEKIVEFPIGTRLNIEKAVQYTNGVSGASYPALFGTIYYEGDTYKIAYQWGDIDLSKAFDKIEKCWRFHQAPWQEQEDHTFYALPTATLW